MKTRYLTALLCASCASSTKSSENTLNNLPQSLAFKAEPRAKTNQKKRSGIDQHFHDYLLNGITTMDNFADISLFIGSMDVENLGEEALIQLGDISVSIREKTCDFNQVAYTLDLIDLRDDLMEAEAEKWERDSFDSESAFQRHIKQETRRLFDEEVMKALKMGARSALKSKSLPCFDAIAQEFEQDAARKRRYAALKNKVLAISARAAPDATWNVETGTCHYDVTGTGLICPKFVLRRNGFMCVPEEFWVGIPKRDEELFHDAVTGMIRRCDREHKANDELIARGPEKSFCAFYNGISEEACDEQFVKINARIKDKPFGSFCRDGDFAHCSLLMSHMIDVDGIWVDIRETEEKPYFVIVLEHKPSGHSWTSKRRTKLIPAILEDLIDQALTVAEEGDEILGKRERRKKMHLKRAKARTKLAGITIN